MTLTKAYLLFLSVCVSHAPAYAGDGDVIVSAMRTPRFADQIGSTVSTLSAEDISLRQYNFAADALRDIAGVTIARNSGFGGFASARIRGASSGQTLVVIDGLVMNDPAAPQGGFDFANLDIVDIETIEVLRGPQGLIYGADAIGGVISIRTKTTSGISAFAEGGSFGTARGGAVLSAGEDTFGRLSVSGIRTDGFSRADGGNERDGYRNISISTAAGVSLNDVWRAEIRGRFSDSHAEIDGFPPPDFSLADTFETEDTQSYAVVGKLAHSADKVRGVATIGYNDVDRANFDGGIETFAATGDRLSADYVGEIEITGNISGVFGAEFDRTSVDVSGVDQSATAGALFALAELRPTTSLVLSAGARRDEFSNFSGETTARLAAVWSPASNTHIRASWGQGFRAPTLFELNFDQFGVVPNPDLRPERANGFDAGVETELGESALRVTFFHQKVRDQIDFDFAGSGYFNIDRTRSRGVEAEFEWVLSNAFSASANYTFTSAIDKSTGAQLLRQPKHSGAIILTAVPLAKLSLSTSLIFNGRESDFPAANDGFIRADIRAAYSLSDRVDLYGRIENLTDTDYQDVSGYQEAGRSAFFGIRVKG